MIYALIIIFLGLLITLCCIFVFAIIGMYNTLIVLRNQVRNSFSTVEIQLQRRYDLIPNIVDVAKKYMDHEFETLESVTYARTAAVNASNTATLDPTARFAVQRLSQSEQVLNGALGRLMALREAYPNLKADTQMTLLIDQLNLTENRIAQDRALYNQSVMEYNNKTELFPSSLVASLFKFIPAEFFLLTGETNGDAPSVNFSAH